MATRAKPKSPVQEKSLVHETKRKAALDASWQRRRLEIASKIEHCALTLFVEHGLEAVSVDDISRAAEVSRRSFYRYFESPGDIVRTVLCRSMDRWAEVFGSRPAEESILDSFRSADADIKASPEDLALIGLALTLKQRSPDAWSRISGPIQAHTARAFQDIIAERMRIRGEDPQPAGAISAALTAIMMHLSETSLSEGQVPEPEAFERAIAAFQKLMTASSRTG